MWRWRIEFMTDYDHIYGVHWAKCDNNWKTLPPRMSRHCGLLKAEMSEDVECWRKATKGCWAVFFFEQLGAECDAALTQIPPPLKKDVLSSYMFCCFVFHFGTDSNCSWAFHLTYWSYLVVLGFSLFVLFLMVAGWVDFDLKVGKWYV